jgi:GT2 family glycosyltransferase
MSRAPTVAVLMACHNRRATTLACLAALAAQTGVATLSPIIYDDGSADGTADAVARAHPHATVLRGSGTAFWAGGMRAAFDHALAQGFDHYLWLNDDVVLDADAVARLLTVAWRLADASASPVLVGGAVRDPRTGASGYGGIARRPGSRSPLRFVPVAPHPIEPRRCATLNGNVVLIPRATAEAVGSIGCGFIHTLGDLDYGLRVGRAGGIVVLAPGSVGACAANPGAARFFDPATPLRTRWRLLAEPRGFPLRPWLRFARTHGGPLWPLHAMAPLWRLAVPATLTAPRSRAKGERVHAV